MKKMSLSDKILNAIKKISYVITNPSFALKYSKRFSDDFTQDDLEYCIPHLYKFRVGKTLNLSDVNTFNEKLNWLKCFYHNDKMTECVDKVTAPYYFKKCTGLGDEYIVKNIGIFNSAKEIDFNSLPNRFVLKSNWGSGKQIIVQNKNNTDINKMIKEMSAWNDITSNHYYRGFEYGYKNISPKIVCEEFIDFEYKMEFFCFDGNPCYFWTVYNDKTDEVSANFYDALTLKKLDLSHGYPNSQQKLEVPKEYNQMLEIAKVLSKNWPFVRIDFFKTKNGFKFSEMTFYHWCGFMPFTPDYFDKEFGKKIKLPNKII